MKKPKTLSLLLAASLCASLFAACGVSSQSGSSFLPAQSSDGASSGDASDSSSDKVKKDHIGLYAEGGTLMRDGKPYRGIGINYLGLFYDALNGKPECIDSLDTLAEYGVDCIRVPVNATYNAKVMQKQFDDEETWWGLLDAIVEKAEEIDIGLICGFFWSEDVIPKHFGEDIAESLRDENSLSWQYMDGYIEKFIARYGESEAIWGWEYGNEIMLEAQVPPSNTATGTQRFTCDDVIAVYSRFIESVNRYDPYHRFIGSGDAGLRAFSYNGYRYNSTFGDTKTEQTEMCGKLYPMDGVSWHSYSNSVTAIDSPDLFVNPPDYHDESGKTVKLYKTWKEYLGYVTELAAAHGKIPYLGETAFTYADSEKEVSEEEVYRGMEGILKAVYETDFPLAIVWNYDPLAEETSTVKGSSNMWGNAFNEQSARGRGILRCIRDYNRKIKEKL